MSEVKLLPLPEGVEFVFAAHDNAEGYGMATAGKCYYTPDQMRDYARANMEPLIAEIERLRAKYQLAAESSEHFAARAERLAEALRWIASDETAAASTIHSGMDEVDAIKVRARAALDQEGGK